MSKYGFELSENERLLMIIALGSVAQLPAIVSEQSEPPATSIELARRLVLAVPNLNQRNPALPTATEVRRDPQPPAAPPAKRQEIPEGAIELGVTPTKIVKVGSGQKERLMVKWDDAGKEGIANCWTDQKSLWPRVLERVKKPSVFYVKQSGIYLNIVGVK